MSPPINVTMKGKDMETHLRRMKDCSSYLQKRNMDAYSALQSYKTSYKSGERFLLGSWLLSLEVVEPPFNKKAVIIIDSNQNLVDVASVEDIEIVLANSLSDVIKSYYFRLTKEELIIFMDGVLYEINEEMSLPKYAATLDKHQEKIRKKNIINYNDNRIIENSSQPKTKKGKGIAM